MEQSRELYDWLEQGANIYLCGDRQRLAPSVDRALIDVVMKEGAKSRDQATEYVEHLRKETRYLKDVY